MLVKNLIGCGQYSGINSTCIVQKIVGYLLNVYQAEGIYQGLSIELFLHIQHCPCMWHMLNTRLGMLELCLSFCDIIRHGDVYIAIFIFPIDSYAKV